MARRALGPATLAVVAAIEQLVRPAPPAGASAPALLVACSGGADSLALLAGAAELARRGQLVGCVTVDHGLQAGSAQRAAGVARISTELGVTCRVETVGVQATGAGTEADARAARYAALERAALDWRDLGTAKDPVPIDSQGSNGGDIPSAALYDVDSNGAERANATEPATVLLGHTLDDQAETVLLGLARGSGARSLGAMAELRRSAAGVGYARPLLELRRRDTEAACAELGLTPWNDPMNRDPRYARVRARRTVLPMLEEQLGPGVAQALARTAAMLREDADALDDLAGVVGEPTRFARPTLPVADLDARPALRRRQLRAWLLANGAVLPGRGHVLDVEKLITDWHGQRAIEVPGLKVLRRAQALEVVTD